MDISFPSKYILIKSIEFIDIRLDFYHNKKRINSCQELIDSNLTNRQTIFQIPFSERAAKRDRKLILRDVEYKSKICPLVFENANIIKLLLINLVNSFYKTNVLAFENLSITTAMHSSIEFLGIYNFQNIDLDINILNRLVFKYTINILLESGSLNSINEETFKILNKITRVGLNPLNFRKINNKQGINWIKNMNNMINVISISKI